MTQVGIRERVSMRRHAGISQLLRRIALTDEARRVTISSDSALDVKSHILWIDYGGKLPMGGRTRSWQAKKPSQQALGVPVTAQCRGRIER